MITRSSHALAVLAVCLLVACGLDAGDQFGLDDAREAALSFPAVRRPQLRLPDSTQRTLVALTYDDGLYTQRTQAAPQLDSLGLRGTFFLNSVEGREAVLGWRAIAAGGHELANHSLFHPCPRSYGWPDGLATEDYDSTRFLDELRTQHDLIGHVEGSAREQRSYAHPCNYHFVDTPAQSTLPLLAASPLVDYGRTGGDRDATLDPDTPYEPLAVPSWTVDEGASGAELIAFAELARARGGAAVYTFHGVGADWLIVSREAHWALAEHLAQHADRFEVVTFGDLARRMVPPEVPPAPPARVYDGPATYRPARTTE